MLKFIFICAVFVVTCHGDEVTTTALTPTVDCGEGPVNLFICLQSVNLITATALSQCKSDTNQCAVMTCIFRESGWLKDGAVNNDKLREFFELFAAENPVWSLAVEQLKINCLVEAIRTQGLYLDYPAYNVMYCIVQSFVKNIPASHKLTKEEWACLGVRD